MAFRGSVRLVAAFVCLAGLRAGPVFGQDCNGNGIADGNELFGAMTLASVDSSGAAGTDSSFDVTLSADARYVAFYSLADDLVPDDGNGQTDVFRVDRWTRVVTRLPNSDRGFATIDMTPDGRFIGYVRETDYMGSSTPQLWLYDHETGASELVSVDGTGAPGDSWSLSPVMSADGRYVAFWSMASNLIPDDTNGKADVFRRDRLTGGIIRVSVGAAGEEGDGHSGPTVFGMSAQFVGSFQVAVSADARFVAFASDATNLVPHDTNGVRDIFVHDCVTGHTERISVSSTGEEANAGSSGSTEGTWQYPATLDISSDGRFITFDSWASNFDPADASGFDPDIFVHDRQTGTTTRVPADRPGLVLPSGNPLTYRPRLSDDGRFVVFRSNVNFFTPFPATGSFNVFRYDLFRGEIVLESSAPDGSSGNDSSGGIGFTMTRDGRHVAFPSFATNLTDDVIVSGSQVFIRDRFGGTDCDGNGALDECDILSGAATDCDGNGVPDACDFDCNADGIPDACEIADCIGDPACADCNGNTIPDGCDISPTGAFSDCDGDLVPDICAPPVYYVDVDAAGLNDGSSWDNAFNRLQDGVSAAAAAGCDVAVVRVAAGTYTPTDGPGDQSASFQLANGVVLEGGYAGFGASDPNARNIVANETILSGDLAGDDLPGFVNMEENSFHVVVVPQGVDRTAVLDGFVVEGGNADVPMMATAGGGMWIIDAGLTITRCAFRANKAQQGGGIYQASGLGFQGELQPLLADCVFVGNTAEAGAGLYATVGNSPLRPGRQRVERCVFTQNTVTGTHSFLTVDGGGGAYVRFGEWEFVDCTFVENSAVLDGGGAISDQGADLIVKNCTFVGNSAGRFGGGASSSGGTRLVLAGCSFFSNTAGQDGGGCRMPTSVVNSVFSGNHAGSDGGAVWVWVGQRLANCTIVSNSAGGSGGGAFGGWVANCLFFGNSDSSGVTEFSQITTDGSVTYSFIQGLSGGVPGAGNVTGDPRLIDPDGADDVPGTADDDLRIAAGSVCIDHGDNTIDIDLHAIGMQPIPFLDFLGRLRFVDDPVADDLGVGDPPIVDIGAFEYQADCNDNGTIDSQDLADGSSPDCDMNGVPDECEESGACCLADGTCSVMPEACCEDAGGTFNGVDSTCDDPPTIACPADMTVECDGAGNVSELEAWLHGATASVGVCGDVTVTNDFAGLSGGCGASGSAVVTWTVTDNTNGQSATCSATFTIVDSTPPAVMCSAGPRSAAEGTFRGRGSGVSRRSLFLSGDDGDEDLILDFSAADVCGAVTVTAVIQLTCEDDSQEVAVESGQRVDLECGSDEREVDEEDGVLEIETGGAVLVITATDACGNTATCTVDLCEPADDSDDDDTPGDFDR